MSKRKVCLYIYIYVGNYVFYLSNSVLKKKTGYLRCYSDGISLTTSQISQDHLGSVESQGHRRGTDAAEALGIAGDRRKPW